MHLLIYLMGLGWLLRIRKGSNLLVVSSDVGVDFGEEVGIRVEHKFTHFRLLFRLLIVRFPLLPILLSLVVLVEIDLHGTGFALLAFMSSLG
jgi:hypothetical protein